MFNHDFENCFEQVLPIILKLKRSFYIQLWDRDDWLQEGRIILHYLMEDNPDLADNRMKLLCYFKTKFTSHIKDTLRYQESAKRRFNRLPYDEIGDVSHKIAEDGLKLDDIVAFHTILNHLTPKLSENEMNQIQALFSNKRFSGRKKLLRKLKPFFVDFQDNL